MAEVSQADHCLIPSKEYVLLLSMEMTKGKKSKKLNKMEIEALEVRVQSKMFRIPMFKQQVEAEHLLKIQQAFELVPKPQPEILAPTSEQPKKDKEEEDERMQMVADVVNKAIDEQESVIDIMKKE